MSAKPSWQMPRLIAINPFGGSNANPYEFTAGQAPSFRNPSGSVAFTAGGDNTSDAIGYAPITDFDPTPASSTFGGPFYVSTAAPLS